MNDGWTDIKQDDGWTDITATPAPKESLSDRIRKTPLGAALYNTVMEAPRLAYETATVPANAILGGLNNIGAIGKAGGSVMRDALGMEQINQGTPTEIFNRESQSPWQIGSPFKPSMTADLISAGVAANNQTARETGNDWAVPVLEGGMQTLAAAGAIPRFAGKVVKPVTEYARWFV